MVENPTPGRNAKAEREKRLAQALRANLKRRKARTAGSPAADDMTASGTTATAE
jgi:hypothetical protein